MTFIEIDFLTDSERHNEQLSLFFRLQTYSLSIRHYIGLFDKWKFAEVYKYDFFGGKNQDFREIRPDS